MTLFQQYVEVFTDSDVDAFRGLHHEDFMFVRETDLLNLDEHIEIIDKLVSDGQMNWHKVAKLVHEDEYMFAARWEQEGDIATNVHLLKDGVSWRAFVSRSPQVR